MDKTFPAPTNICPHFETLLLLIPDLERCIALRPWGRAEEKEGEYFSVMGLCKECGKLFQASENIKCHIVRNHILWSCEECGGGLKL